MMADHKVAGGLANVDAVIWFEPSMDGLPEAVHVRSDAALRTLRYLGGAWSALGVAGRLLPAFVRDRGYDLSATHRHRLVRADASCLVPTPEQRAPFIDGAFGTQG